MSPRATRPTAAVPITDLADADLEAQGAQAHATRNWVFLHGTAEQFATHTTRMLALEGEYLRRHPQRTWQGVEKGTTVVAAADPVRAVLEVVAAGGGRLHKLGVHQAARAAGLPRGELAALYRRDLLDTAGADRVLTESGRAWLEGAALAPTVSAGLRWEPVIDPRWAGDVLRVVGGAEPGVFELDHALGAPLPGDWWSVSGTDATVLGYGWMDVGWGEAEVLLAVAAGARTAGVGTFVLAHLEGEAVRRGLNYVYNTVRPTHPDHDGVHDWLAARGYTGSSTDAALRKRVGVTPEPPTSHERRSPAADAGTHPDRGPGHEDQGGYVDVENHAY